MTIQNPCVTCILGQVEKTLAVLSISESLKETIRNEARAMAPDFSFAHTPPFVAKDVYQMISRISGIDDPLEDVKQASIEAATALLPFVYEKIRASDDPLFAAIKAAVAGNVIDFGAKEQFDLNEEIAKVFDTPFAIDDYEKLSKEIRQAGRLMILADNSGENVFDKVLIETIKTRYPDKEVFYAVRGRPIINDITLLEARQVGLDKVATLVDTGVDTPGLDLLRADPDFIELYRSMPLVIAKGMGNYECLEASSEQNIYFLFKVKCEVVSDSVKRPIGSIILTTAR